MRNWLMRLWMLRNPTICHLQTKDSRKQVVYKSVQIQRPVSRGANVCIRVNHPRQRVEDEIGCLSSSRETTKKGQILSLFVLLRHSLDWMMTTHIGRAVYLAESTE